MFEQNSSSAYLSSGSCSKHRKRKESLYENTRKKNIVHSNMATSDSERSILTKIGELNINDTNVNKMRRNRSARIQEQQQRKQSLNVSLSDLFNNNIWLTPRTQTNHQIDAIEKDTAVTEPTPVTAKSIEGKVDDFELERENIHFQRSMKLFTYITRNEYVVRGKKSTEDDSDDCGCVLSKERMERGERGCGVDCLNRQMSIECNADCKLGPYCGNQRIQKVQNARCTVFITEQKGNCFGICS